MVLFEGCAGAEEEKTDPPTVGLDRWLAERESRSPDLIPGTEKVIIWNDKADEKTPLALVYIHGFSATRREIAPTLDIVADQLGANLFYTRLTGHGRGAEAMADATIEKWKTDVAEALEIGKRLGDRVIVAATSTGAPLAAWLATEYSEISAVVLISANFQPANKMTNIILWPGGRIITRIAVGKRYSFEPQNADHARYWTTSYPPKALLPMMQACRLGIRSPLEHINAPVLFLYTEDDDVVDLEALKKAYERVGSEKKQLIQVREATDHVMAGDIISPQATGIVVSHIVSFIQEAVLTGSAG